MNHARSQDGTTIAFDRLGSGPPLVIVAAALQGRASYHPLAEALSGELTVLNYDRRGRGDSGDTAPYAIEREVEDLAAVLTEAGGRASVYGHSSGAALVMHAAAQGLPMHRIVLHEPPFGSGSEEERQAEQEEADRIAAFLADGRPGDAVAEFLSSAGVPPEAVSQLRHDPTMLAHAPTLLHDFAVLSVHPADLARDIASPTMVLAGGASPDWQIDACRRIADAVPDGRLRVLEGQEHVVPAEVLAPVVAGFVLA